MKYIKSLYGLASFLLFIAFSGLGYEYDKNWIPVLYFVLWTLFTALLIILYGDKIFMKKASKKKLKTELKKVRKSKPKSERTPASDPSLSPSERKLLKDIDEEIEHEEKQEEIQSENVPSPQETQQDETEKDGGRLFVEPGEKRNIPGFDMDDKDKSQITGVDTGVFSETIEDNNIQHKEDVDKAQGKATGNGTVVRGAYPEGIEKLLGEVNELKAEIQKKEQQILKLMGVK